MPLWMVKMAQGKRIKCTKVKITITIDPELLEGLDKGILSGKFNSRSHGIHYYVKQGIARGWWLRNEN